jgi:hypothetical protein
MLQGDEPAELDVLGFIYNAHATAAQLLNDAVVGDGLAKHFRESYVAEMGKSNESRGVGEGLKRIVGDKSPLPLTRLWCNWTTRCFRHARVPSLRGHTGNPRVFLVHPLN